MHAVWQSASPAAEPSPASSAGITPTQQSISPSAPSSGSQSQARSGTPASPANDQETLPTKRSLAPELEAEPISPSVPSPSSQHSTEKDVSRRSLSPADAVQEHAQLLRERRESHRKTNLQVSAHQFGAL